MNIIDIEPRPWNSKVKAARETLVERQSVHIESSSIVMDRESGQPALIYLSDCFDASSYLKTMRNVKFDGPKALRISDKLTKGNNANAGGMRMSGIITSSVTFGSIQAQPGRQRFQAARCRNNFDQPKAWFEMRRLAAEFFPKLRDAHYPPPPFGDHQQEIYDAWKIDDTPFTSLIVNSGTSAYPYHRDSGNVAGSWSAMPVIRGRNSQGGYLCVPELGVSLECASGDVAAFPGADLWHGVTPITGDRWSVVFYAKQGLAKAAATENEELRHGQIRRTRYEQEGVDK